MMDSIVNMIQDFGVEMIHIPGRCTYLCQPLAVSISKPIKTRIREEWEEFMVETINLYSKV